MTNVYTQTNELENRIIVYRQEPDGQLIEIERVPTGGKGTGGYTPVTGEQSSPDSLISSNSVIVSRNRKYLFAVNAGNNTVTCLAIGAGGRLTLRDVQATGNAPSAVSGTANSLAYNESDGVLYVLHAFGPDHIRAFTVTEGKLSLRPLSRSVNVAGLIDRVPTQIVLTPDNRYLLASVLFDARPGEAGLVPAKEKALVTFPIAPGGDLGQPVFNEAGGVTPFASVFLNGSSDTFVTVLAAESSAVLSTIGPDGKVRNGRPAKIDTVIDGKAAEPSEICWISVSEDNRYAFGTNFGYGTVSSFKIDSDGLAVRMSTAAKELGDGTFKGLAGVPSSGAGDSVVSGPYFYQLYANARKLVGYKIGDDGRLTKLAEAPVPYNSTQGLAAI